MSTYGSTDPVARVVKYAIRGAAISTIVAILLLYVQSVLYEVGAINDYVMGMTSPMALWVFYPVAFLFGSNIGAILGVAACLDPTNEDE